MIRKFLKFAIGAITMAVVAALFAITAIEWVAGCGGYYIDAVGRKVYKECVIVPYHKPEVTTDE